MSPSQSIWILGNGEPSACCTHGWLRCLEWVRFPARDDARPAARQRNNLALVVIDTALVRIALPLAAATLIAVHFWRIRRDGGLARPL